MAKRVIAHLDCDAFYVSVELRERPELRGLPVIVAGSGPRSVVTTASYEARRFGVGSAMPAAEARRRCPQAIVLAPDFARYREVSQRVWTIVGAHLPVLQRMGLDEAYSDLSGMQRPLPRLRAVIAEVLEQTGIQVSAGIAPNRLVAKIASDLGKPAGFVAIGREQAAQMLADRTVRLIPGIGPRTAARLGELGATTIGELQQIPVDTLAERFGPRHGRDLHRRAFLHDDSPVVLERAAKSRSKEITFDADVDRTEVLEATVREMATSLAADLRRRRLLARNVAIKLRWNTFETITRARTLPLATDSGDVVTRAALELLSENAPERPVRLVGVRVAALSERDAPVVPSALPEQLTLPLEQVS